VWNRDIVYDYLRYVFNPIFKIKLFDRIPEGLRNIFSQIAEKIWESETLDDLINNISLLTEIYILIPQEERSMFYLLLSKSQEFIKEKTGRSIVLTDKVKEFDVNLKIIDRDAQIPIAACSVIVSRDMPLGGWIESFLTDAKGNVSFKLPMGIYRIAVFKKGADWYVLDIFSLKVSENVRRIINVRRHKRERAERPLKKVELVVTTLPHRIDLPRLPPEWEFYIDNYPEKYMQMAFTSQLRALGHFMGEELSDIRHTFTGFKGFPDIYHHPTLKYLVVTKEMDVLALTKTGKLIGFEHKSRKGLMQGHYGFNDALQYFPYGIEYVYLVHRRINDDFHERILEFINEHYPYFGYITYSPKELEVLKEAEINPMIDRSDVRERGEFIKKHFNRAGGTKGPPVVDSPG